MNFDYRFLKVRLGVEKMYNHSIYRKASKKNLGLQYKNIQ